MKIPRDLDSDQFVKGLQDFAFLRSRHTGSLLRLSRTSEEGTHPITIPKHSPLKSGTLNSIPREISSAPNIPKEEILKKL